MPRTAIPQAELEATQAVDALADQLEALSALGYTAPERSEEEWDEPLADVMDTAIYGEFLALMT